MAENSLQITLMKWKEWPDFNVPLSALGMMRILKTIRDVPNTTAVIHCSAGIGRYVLLLKNVF
jgi:protein tyrosine phosphatase